MHATTMTPGVPDIRNYVNALSVASTAAKTDISRSNDPYCFRVHGQVNHRIGGLRPREGDPPQCAQVLPISANLRTDGTGHTKKQHKRASEEHLLSTTED